MRTIQNVLETVTRNVLDVKKIGDMFCNMDCNFTDHRSVLQALRFALECVCQHSNRFITLDQQNLTVAVGKRPCRNWQIGLQWKQFGNWKRVSGV